MRIARKLLTGLLITWGLLALLVRAATPIIAEYRDEFAAVLSQRLDTPVRITGLEARWYGFTPLLELHGVTLGSAPESLEVGKVALALAPGELLGGRFADALHVAVEGLELTVVREPNGQLHLEGLGPVSPAARGGGKLALPSDLHLVDTRVIWVDRKADRPPVAIDDVNVTLNRSGTRLDLHARLTGGGGEAELAARLDGFLGTTGWRGETYLKVGSLDVARLFSRYLPHDYGMKSLLLDLDAWTRWQDARPEDSRGEVRLRKLVLRPRTADAGALAIAEAAAGFSLQLAPAGLRIGLKDLVVDFGDHRWPASDLAFSLARSEDGVQRLALAADYLRIEDLVRTLKVRLPWAGLTEPLQNLQPRGEIRDLRLHMRGGGEWRAAGRFDGLATSPWNDLPGIDRLSGELHGQQDHVALQLDSRDTTLRFTRLFRDPLHLRELSGRLDIARDVDGWQVRSDRLVADTPHIRTLNRLLLQQQADRSLWLDLQSDFHDGDAASAYRYYPVAVMSEKLVGWLDRAIVSGRVSGGTALVHGPLRDFPFEHERSGTFQVLFETEDLVLDYLEDWPRLEDLDAQVRFHGNRLGIETRSGRVYDSRITATAARIDSLTPSSALEVQGAVEGPLRNTLRVLQETPLRARFGQFAEILRGQGDARLLLDFSVPLDASGSPALAGRLRFDGNTLTLPSQGIALSGIAGELRFDLGGLTAQGIRAEFLGSPVTVDVLPLADGTTRVQTQGRLAMDAIARQFPALPLQPASGAADFEVRVDVPPSRNRGQRSVMLGVSSRLEDVAIDLPAPLGKVAGEGRELRVEVPLDGPDPGGGLIYGQQMSARFSRDGQRIDVLFGNHGARLGDRPGVRVGGQLAKLDAGAWVGVLDGMTPTDPAPDRPVTIDLQIGELAISGSAIDRLHLTAVRDAGEWRGRVDADDLAGHFSLPPIDSGRPLQVDLDHLALEIPVATDEPPDVPVQGEADGPDPRGLPGLELQIADLRINQAQLGRMELTAQHAPEGLRVTGLNLRGGQLQLESAGHWSRSGTTTETATETTTETRLGGSVSSARLGDLLVDLGYSRQLEEAPASLEFLLQWPGSPAQAGRAVLQGKVSLEIGAGRLVELDPGATRVVGLLNLNALTRRLRLDFSDFYKKGYTFDRISGDFAFAGGRATTDNLTLLSPTGRIEVRGTTDLVARSLDQHVVVTPNLDATLPIAGAIAGGPVAGIAVLVAQKVMSKEVDRLNRFEYSLTGPWAEPEVRKLGTGGTLSRILQPLDGNAQDDEVQSAGQGAPPADPQEPAGATDKALGGQAPPADRPAEAAPSADGSGNPLRGLLDLLEKGDSHGAELPGSKN